MLGTRYEEYSQYYNNLPFRLTPDIEITSSSYSHEANWHENLELQLCTAGQGSVMLDEKSIPFCKNDIILINSNVIHHTNTTGIIRYTYRCKKAAEYIVSGCSISESARLCGFTNMSFFTKTFKLCMGKMPSKYKTKK